MDAIVPRLEDSAAAVGFHTIEQPFVGRWNQLVSTTNWEKGRIVHDWREALIAAGAPSSEYSDDSWSRRVGGVTGQHVGRLRRVYQRFSATQERYPGLFWSHFQAALDWDDAEMWLTGAAQNSWSVSEMRGTRSETLGAVSADAPDESESMATELDEDFVSEESEPNAGDRYADDRMGPPIPEGPDFGDADDHDPRPDYGHPLAAEEDRHVEQASLVRPFESLPELPPDFADAFDNLKLSILRHKAEGWEQVSIADVIGALDALKELAMAPSADAAPF